MGYRRTLIVALLAGATAFVVTATLYQQAADIVIDFDNAYEGGFVRDFHERERDGDRYFRWTRDQSFIDLHHLPVDATLAVDVRLRIFRRSGERLPNLAFTVDGTTVHQSVGAPGVGDYAFQFRNTKRSVEIGIPAGGRDGRK